MASCGNEMPTIVDKVVQHYRALGMDFPTIKIKGGLNLAMVLASGGHQQLLETLVKSHQLNVEGEPAFFQVPYPRSKAGNAYVPPTPSVAPYLTSNTPFRAPFPIVPPVPIPLAPLIAP